MAAREAILAAALNAFARRGFDGASLPDMAADVGVRHSLILYHFGSKEELWRAVMAQVFGELRAQYGAVAELAQDLDALAALKMFIRAFVQFSSRYPDRVMLVLNEMRGDTPRMRWLFEEYLLPLHRQVDAMVERAIADGCIKPIPAAHLAHILIGAGSTFFLAHPLVQAIYGIDSRDPAAVASHTDWLVEALLNGLMLRKSG